MSGGDVIPYTSKVTSEHQGAPKFMATLAASCQPFADVIAGLQAILQSYDLDQAQGAQLDVLGLWIGASRFLEVALAGVFFSFDTPGVGLDQGSWFGPFDSGVVMTRLPDDAYRTLLKAQILANQWDGTIPGAYTAYGVLFQGQAFTILIQDHGDMTMTLIMVGAPPSAVTKALFTSGLLSLRPAGVLENFTFVNNVAFAFDVASGPFGGFDVGSWTTFP